MPSRHTERLDLFAVAGEVAPAERHALPPKPRLEQNPESLPPRYLLPKDLAGALTHLSDAEIDTLLATVTREAERRDRFVASKKSNSSGEADRNADLAPGGQVPLTKPRRSTDYGAARSLTLGQTNAVRAAFLAGVKPSIIARQFGISQAAVKQVLAMEIRGRK